MSRRREAADLARALLLSAEDQDLSFPSSVPTVPFDPSDPPSVPSDPSRSSVMDTLHLAAMPGGAQTSSGSRISEIGAFSGSSGHPPPTESGIKPFTPSYHHPPKNILVPPSFTPPPIPRSSVIIPSSNLPRSSPLVPGMPKSGKSSTHTPSTGPLFSPTHTSALNALAASAPPPPQTDRPAIVRTYGKTASNISPEKASEPANPRMRVALLLSSSPKAPSSDEIQEEVEMDSRLEGPSSKSKANAVGRVEVVIPSRGQSNAQTKRLRTHSPDPLDSLQESMESEPAIESIGNIFALPAAAAPPPASRASASTSTNTQTSKFEESGRRVSARVQLHKEEEEKQKAERRRKRAEEKARLKEEEERKARGLERKRSEKERPATSVKLSREERSARRSDVAEMSKEASPRREKVQKEKSSRAAREIIEIDDEESIIPLPRAPAPPSPKLVTVPEKRQDGKEKARKRKSGGDDTKANEKVQDKATSSTHVATVAQVSPDKEASTSKSSKISPDKGKSKKRSRVVDSSDEDEEVDKSPAKYKNVDAKSENGTKPVMSPAKEDEAEEEDAEEEKDAEPTLKPSKVPSPLGDLASNRSREPLRPIPPQVNSPAPARESPGPNNAPGGIKWKTSRSDLSSVLSKFPGAKYTGMSRRHRIPSLHTKIGPPVKALPPPPPKPTRKKKGDSDDEDEEEEQEESDGEGGVRMVKRGKKEKGIEWFMQED